MEIKVCKKCGRELPISEFYVHKQMGDGYLNFCKECVKSRVHKHREDNIERIREYDRNRHNSKERGKKQREALKNNIERYKKFSMQKKEWAKRNREKRIAHYKLKKAIDNGIILKPNICENCGKTNCIIEGHHFDYTKPLEVKWLCCECHGKEHRRYKKESEK